MIDAKQFDGHTPGPWEWQWTDDGGDNDGDVLYALPAGYDREVDEPDKTPLVTPAFRDGLGLGPEDARLMAGAPKLLEEVERLRAENARLREMFEAAVRAVKRQYQLTEQYERAVMCYDDQTASIEEALREPKGESDE